MEYRAIDQSKNLQHWKYIKRYKGSNGKWRYVYRSDTKTSNISKTSNTSETEKSKSSSGPTWNLGSGVSDRDRQYIESVLDAGGLNGSVWDNATQSTISKHYSKNDISKVNMTKEYVGYGDKGDDRYYNFHINIKTNDGKEFNIKRSVAGVRESTAAEDKTKLSHTAMDKGVLFVKGIL